MVSSSVRVWLSLTSRETHLMMIFCQVPQLREMSTLRESWGTESTKRFWWFHLYSLFSVDCTFGLLFCCLLSVWMEWRLIDVEKPLFGLFSSIQVGFGVEGSSAFRFAHCPKKIPSSPILCDWVSKPKFRTWRKVLKEEKWGIWSQMAKLLLLVPKVVVRVPSWEKSSASRKNSSTFFFFSSCCVFMAKSWISALAWCWQKWLRLKWKLDSPFAKSLLTTNLFQWTETIGKYLSEW